MECDGVMCVGVYEWTHPHSLQYSLHKCFTKHNVSFLNWKNQTIQKMLISPLQSLMYVALNTDRGGYLWMSTGVVSDDSPVAEMLSRTSQERACT